MGAQPPRESVTPAPFLNSSAVFLENSTLNKVSDCMSALSVLVVQEKRVEEEMLRNPSV